LKKSLLKIIFTLVFLELFLGGTGRLTELTAFLTLRMCLFIVYMVLSIIYLIKKHTIPKEIVFIIAFFCFIMTFDSLIGYANGASSSVIFEDVKPLLNVFLLCYLSFSITKIEDIRYLIKLLKISSILLVVLHFVLFGLVLVFSDIGVIYSALSASNNEDSSNVMFFFKGDSGFVNYTGDLYLCVGFIVWEQYHKKSLVKYLALASLAIAIVLTGTRGLIFALAGVYIIKWLILKLNYKSLISLILGAVFIVGVYFQIKNNIGDKDNSDQTRYDTIGQVVDRINPVSFFVGHGLGVGVPVRPVHMEISYLEIFQKQGLIGLFWYFCILLIAYLAYKHSFIEDSIGLYMCVIFIYLLSFTNPYINHPLGITVIAVSIVSLIKLRQFEDQKVLLQ